MKNNNICKFVTTTSEKQIFTTNFVLENQSECLQNIYHTKNYSVRLVLSGKGRLYHETMSRKLQAGTVFFTLPGVSYYIDVDDDFKCMYITFHGLRAQELLQRFRIAPENCVFEGHDGLLAFWQNCLSKASESNLDLISESVLLYTFAQMSPPVITGKQRLVDDILEYIEENFKEASLSLSTLAQHLGYNSKYLSKVFKDELGTSFTEYVKNIRIQHAVFLMERGITTVKNLTLLCGFTDPYYFSNVFKKVVGTSPSKYIERFH